MILKKKKPSLSNISAIIRSSSELIMISKDLLLIPGENIITLININEYILLSIIEVPGASWLLGVCMLSENMIVMGSYLKAIYQWKIEGNNLIVISKKENAHNGNISYLIKLDNGYIASASDDSSIYVW